MLGFVQDWWLCARHWWLCIRCASRGTVGRANSWAWITGLGALAVGADIMGHSLEFASGLWGTIAQGLAGMGAAWLLIFRYRLVLAPSRLYSKSQAEIRRLEEKLAALEATGTNSPLEIIFDPTNPELRFWSEEIVRLKVWKHAIPMKCREYRGEVRNASGKTVKNVCVVKEHVSTMPRGLGSDPFDMTRTELNDLHPYCSAMVPILRRPPPGKAAHEFGPIRVTASGDDVPPSRRAFNFDQQREPMIYD